MKIITGKTFGISKIGAAIISIKTVAGYEVMRNLSDWSDQTLTHIDEHANYLPSKNPHTPSNAISVLLKAGGAKVARVNDRYRGAYGLHEVMLHIDGIEISGKQ